MQPQAEKVYKNLLWQDSDRMSGAICFYGTRIRVEDFYGWIETGGTVEDFLASFPSVKAEMVSEVLKLNQEDLAHRLEAA